MVLVIPFFLLVRFNPFRYDRHIPLPYAQTALGLLVFFFGLYLLVSTIRLFIVVGKGTLAPWDPTARLVVRGPYRRVRNPMIAGVLFMILGEAIFFGSTVLATWCALFGVLNTIYFRLSEEPGLKKRFGDSYLEYRTNVPMWIPRIRPWDPPGRGNRKA
jgi:protein-S-isoprenylcysteine O-methyltransferase Ste14